MNYYANTAKHPLTEHLFAVGIITHTIISNLTNNDKLAMGGFVAGCFHDIGKIDPAFQLWLSKTKTKKPFSFDEHPRHNEISLMLYTLLLDPVNKTLNRKQLAWIAHGIYWHHAKPIRKIDYTNQHDIRNKFANSLNEDNDITSLIDTARNILESINILSPLQLPPLLPATYIDEDAIDNLINIPLPPYKTYSESNETFENYKRDIKDNSHKNIIRGAVVVADRIVSALSADELITHTKNHTLVTLAPTSLSINSTLKSDINVCLSVFNEKYPNSKRNTEQTKAANSMTNSDGIVVLKGPAGCGKTKIALEWAAMTDAKKIIWICPRVEICLGLFGQISEYLPNTKVEICTGQHKKMIVGGVVTEIDDNNIFNGDIVITTIDYAINTISTHYHIGALITTMNSHVIFDEWHEFVTISGLNLLFCELIENMKLQEKPETLLISATSNNLFLDEVLEIDNIHGIDSFNKSDYCLSFTKDYMALKEPIKHPWVSFVISNTAVASQLGFINNMTDENGILFHSKFTVADRSVLFDKICENFGQNGIKGYNVMRSGPVVQSSLNITCDDMIIEYTTAENTLQRIGRLNRFGNASTSNCRIVMPLDMKATYDPSIAFLRGINSFESAKVWNEYLSDKITNPITLDQLYSLYDNFYKEEVYLKAIRKDLLSIFKIGTQNINKNIVDPISYPTKKKKPESIRIKNNSLRGDSRFAKMAQCHISNSREHTITDEYAEMTISVDEMAGYCNDDKNLIQYMIKNHHIIMEVKKGWNITEEKLKYLAKDPLEPIYLSYTPKELNGIKPHNEAIYYAVCDKQPVGVISISKINQYERENNE